jgi:nucleotide sugar dehydrogenase
MLKDKIYNYKNILKRKKYKIAVWGTGYIGLSTMIYFSKKNIQCLGFDIDQLKVNKINKGIIPLTDLEKWYGFNISKLIKSGNMAATSKFEDLISNEFLVHFIAIPTEKDGKPYFNILFDVLEKITKLKKLKLNNPPLIIIESTLTPKFSEKKILPYFNKHNIKIGEDILYSVAPRRDWFVEGTKTLDKLDRVFGSADFKSGLETKRVLSIVCKKLHQATSHKEAEMVKSVENAYRHMDITLANQISLAYPNENIREVMRLVGTKWNLNTYYPGFGTGGYCIPLSSQYVISQVSNKNKLTLLRETLKTDKFINIKIAQSIIKRPLKKIGVLGLSYKGNLKVSNLSPVIPFIGQLRKYGKNVKVCDPFFSSKEIKNICGTEAFKFPNDLKKFDCLIIATDHKQFKKISKKKLINFTKNCKFILDIHGIWENKDFNINTLYKISGDKGWLN